MDYMCEWRVFKVLILSLLFENNHGICKMKMKIFVALLVFIVLLICTQRIIIFFLSRKKRSGKEEERKLVQIYNVLTFPDSLVKLVWKASLVLSFPRFWTNDYFDDDDGRRWMREWSCYSLHTYQGKSHVL